MYCCSKEGLLKTALFVVSLSYYLYIPVFDGSEEPWKVWSICVRAKLLHHVALVSEMLFGGNEGMRTETRLLRYMTDVKGPIHVENVTTEDHTFDGVPVRLYRPVSAKTTSPCVIYFHGGGWTFSSVGVYDEAVSEYARRTGYVFVSVNYRLAPENPFPIPFDDSYKASLHLLRHAGYFGCDEKRIGIAGDSAGGNLAAAVSLKLSETSDVPKLRFQWLIYPVLQALDFQLPSYISNENSLPYFLQGTHLVVSICNYIGITPTAEVISKFLRNRHVSKEVKKSAFGKYVDYRQLPSKYHSVVPEEIQQDSDEELAKRIEDIILNPYFAPLMNSTLSRVPPAFILNAEYDALRDDGLLYGVRLRKDDVEVEEYTAPNSKHMFMLFGAFFPRFDQFDVAAAKFVKFAKKHFQ